MTKAGNAEIQVKLSCYSPNFIEQTAHCDHKPRAVGPGETMAELAVPRGNFARRALFSFAARGE